MIEDRLRSLIDRFPALARAVKSRAGQHLVATLRGARVVRERARFAMHQLGPPRTAGYRLRRSGLRIFVRHEGLSLSSGADVAPTGDVHILNEIFGGTGGQYAYDPPGALGARLDGNPRLKVMDLGGNIGLFGAYAFARWSGATVHSFEPEPTNGRILASVIDANGLHGRWSLTDAAVANYTGEMEFAPGLFADSHPVVASDSGATAGALLNGGPSVSATDPPAQGDDAGQPTIIVRTLDVFEQNHDVDLLKIDIEGGEWSILTDPRMAELKADVIVLEWHARGCPQPDARAAAAELLRAAGYSEQEEVEVATYNGVVWASRAGRD